MTVAGKVLVVTGAGSGIGKALTLELIRRGANVAALDLKQESLDNLRVEAGDLVGQLSFHELNVTDKDKVYRLVSEVQSLHGQVDGVINNAGIIQPFVKINDLEYEAIEKVMRVNFYGTLYMCKAFLPALLERPEAHIVNVSSMGGFLPVPGQSVYGASKAAVKLLTEGLYAELLNTNVAVSVVFPGATETNISQNSGVETPKGIDIEEAKKKFKGLSAEKAAQIIIDGVEKDKVQIFTGKDSVFMNRIYRLNPVRATKFITNQMKDLLG